jgi:cell fate regulator YaaT (PSP1 superfamily)
VKGCVWGYTGAMGKIVGIRLRRDGKIYDFDSGHFVLKKDDRVVVNTEQGKALGIVCVEPRNVVDRKSELPLKKVYRMANKKDIEKHEKNCALETEVFSYCYDQIKEKSLPMCLVTTERLFDGSKIIIFFSAEGRVDFRELVKDLVQRFHTRVEMKQIGVRHQAKMIGGLGPCGRHLCCASFLNSFDPVSIKMAKKQNLSLNPSKISGMCGRLMCCLSYEYDYYNDAARDIPKVGKSVTTTKGEGKIIRQNVLRESITILTEAKEEIEVLYDDIVDD